MSADALMKVDNVDGFEGYEDRIEGDEQPQAGGVIQGNVIKFMNEATWVTRDGEELPYTPKTNGKAERFIQTALREWAYARAYQNSDQRTAEAVVGHHPLDAKVEVAVIGNGGLEECDGALFALIGHDLHESNPRSIVNADMDVLPADAEVAIDHAGLSARLTPLGRERIVRHRQRNRRVFCGGSA
jgi:hypothetical protein